MKFLKNLKHIFAISLLTLGIMFVGVRFGSSEIRETMQSFFIYRTGDNAIFQDTIYQYNLPPSDQIAIIAIDDATLDAYQANSNLRTLTLGKELYTNLAKNLAGAGVKGIAWDILFQNSDTAINPATGKSYEEEFSQILRDTPSVIALGHQTEICDTPYTFLKNKYQNEKYREKIHLTENAMNSCEENLISFIIDNRDILEEEDRMKYAPVLKYESRDDVGREDLIASLCTVDTGGVTTTCPKTPRSVYRDVAWGFIGMNVGNEQENITRPLFLDFGKSVLSTWKSGSDQILQTEERYIYTLPVALYLRSGGTLADLGIDPKTERAINPYFGQTRGSYHYHSLKDVMEMSRVNLIQTFKDKYIFIGESGTAIHDSYISPASGQNIDGVEGHAHFLDGILQKKLLREETELILITSIGIALLMGVLYFFLPKYITPLLAIIACIATIWVSRYLYEQERILVDIFPLFLASSIITYPITYIYKYFVIDRDKRELEQNFGRYIDPTVVEQIARTGGTIELGGEHKELTILFSDIAGFTSISEKLAPNELFLLMVSYLSRMTNILTKQGGTLDKYIGDAVMGFFGAPLTMEDHAIRACQTALLMRQSLPEFNTELKTRGIQEINFRVGLATGDVMVGNIGSKDRFNYTVLGDTVNLASRLEGTGKEYGVHIIISEGTRKLIGDHFHLRELDMIAVKGKNEGIRIYELLGFRDEAVDRTMYDNYEFGLGQYRNGEYMQAGRIWEKYAEIDPPSRIMMERVVQIIQGAIHVENGIYHMTHK